MNSQSRSADSTQSSKKPYSTPTLQVYGSIREVTNTLGMTGALDSAMAKGNNSTGL